MYTRMFQNKIYGQNKIEKKHIPYLLTIWLRKEEARGVISCVRLSMGLDLAWILMLYILVASPVRRVYGLPWRPCSFRSLSSFFGLSHRKFITFHANIRTRIATRMLIAIVAFDASIETEEYYWIEKLLWYLSLKIRCYMWEIACSQKCLHCLVNKDCPCLVISVQLWVKWGISLILTYLLQNFACLWLQFHGENIGWSYL